MRRERVANALYWLTGTNEKGEPNNHLYQHVRIDNGILDSLPEDGVLSDVSTFNDAASENEVEKIVGIDAGPENSDPNDKVYSEDSEISSYLPTNVNRKKEKELIDDEFLKVKSSKKHKWEIGNEPLSEFNVPFLASMAFPTLFPDGKGDPTNNAIVLDTGKSPTEAFANKLKHLIKFAEKCNNKWVYRFAAHPRFAYWAFNILYRKRILGQGSFFLKQNPSEANLSLNDLKSMLLSKSYGTLMSKIMHYGKNITGTNAYWNQARDDLRAIIHQKGPPTIFWTLSCADFHWPEFHQLLCPNSNISDSERRENVINNPHLLDWFFTERTERFVRYWLKESLGASWYWFRYEYALQRGSIHCHGVAKLSDDPNLCELSKQALEGYLASEWLKNNSRNISQQELLKKQCVIDVGQKAENIICDYVDSLTSTNNPCNLDNSNWVKPKIHPSRKRFDDIKENEWCEDYADLVNTVQRHSRCSTAYCLREKGGKLSCRFDYPKQCCEKTHLEYEKIQLHGGTLNYKVKVVSRRNDTRVNSHQPVQLQGWRGNCDIQVIIDYHSCLEYISKYASKGEKLSSVAKDAFTSVISHSADNSNNKSIIQKLMMRAVGERDMGIQEVMHQILSIKFLSSSFQVVTASLDGSRNIKVESGELKTEPSLLDLYAKRGLYASNFPGMLDSNFLDFASNFTKAKLGVKRRTTPVVVKTYPNYSSNPKSPYYGFYCKYQLLKFKPWANSLDNAWNNLVGSDSIYIETWHSFLNTDEAKKIVPNWSSQLHCISEYINEICDDDDTSDCKSGEREEWMFLADLKFENNSNPEETFRIR